MLWSGGLLFRFFLCPSRTFLSTFFVAYEAAFFKEKNQISE